MSASYHIKGNKNDVHQRSKVADMLNPDNGYRGQLKRLGVPTKDHMKDNLKIIKMTQQQNRLMKERQVEDEASKKDLYKLPQFRDVTPRLYENIDNNNEAIPDRGQRNYLTKNAAQVRQNELKQEKKQVRNQMEEELELAKIHDLYRKPEVPKASSASGNNFYRENSQQSLSKDFITQNRLSIAQQQQQSQQQYNSNSNSGAADKHEFYGKVPDYLAERKHQKEYDQEMRRLNAPDPDCPPGMIKLSVCYILKNNNNIFLFIFILIQ